jgi:hypothetical protein
VPNRRGGELPAFVPALAAVVLVLAGCAHQPTPAARAEPRPGPPPQTVTPAAPSPESEFVAPPPAATPTPVRSTTPVVIDPGGAMAREGPRLSELAEAEQARRRTVLPATVVVDDKNLAVHATGNLTESAPSAQPPAEATKPSGPDEGYWRQRVRSLRERWAEAVDAIEELEGRAGQLRTRFYATDDPYVRDGEVKPAWDHALASLEAARKRARETEAKLAEALEEGLRAGALPGWLRDGIDLEPAARPYDPPVQRPRGEPAERDLIGEPEEVDEG